jgi:glycosyltransferase involved in cell wall biosynthesis
MRLLSFFRKTGEKLADPLRVMLVADGRSPITLGWVQMLKLSGFEMDLASTFPCAPIEGIREMEVIPVAFGSLSGSQVDSGKSGTGKTSATRKLVGRFRSLLMGGRYTLGPATLSLYQAQYLRFVERSNPVLVHGLRIPFEGMLAAYTPPGVPLVVSVWGNDLTFHAHGSGAMASHTRSVLTRADGLLADAHRDIRLGGEWGFSAGKETLVVPGGGGIDLEEIAAALKEPDPFHELLPPERPLVVNPRGFRPGSVRNDTFFQAIPFVLQKAPATLFACAGMQGQNEALDWVERLGISQNVRLLSFLPQQQLWKLFQRALVSVSVSQHDGTPNSLLEAMAIGCLPVVGDIESTREWVENGQNGFVVDPGDPSALADAILKGLENKGLRENAVKLNAGIIRERAERGMVAGLVSDFYQELKR